MSKECLIVLKGKEVSYSLKRYKRQKRVNIIVHRDGKIVVTAPMRYPHRFVECIIKERKQWVLDHIATKKLQKNVTIDPRVVSRMKKFLQGTLEQKIEKFNSHYGFTYNRIAIRQQRTRWGSCSAKGNLNFNLRMIYLSEELQDYIVVHELCHLKEMNHSQRFWSLVAQQIPDYQTKRRMLKEFSLNT